jgi:hypothetical protein
MSVWVQSIIQPKKKTLLSTEYMCTSSGRDLAYEIQDPEFKHQYPPPEKSKITRYIKQKKSYKVYNTNYLAVACTLSPSLGSRKTMISRSAWVVTLPPKT